MKDIKQSDSVVRRLPRYYRYLSNLLQMGITRVSSRDLSNAIGNTPSQVRQDFFCFGGFGQQGYGYNVANLHQAISNILGLDEQYNIIIIGAGHLGQALANYSYFEKRGFKLIGLFDIKKAIIGKKIGKIEIMHFDCFEEFLQQNHVDIAVLTVPQTQVNEVADYVTRLGIDGIWNFTPIEPKVGDNVIIENIQLSDSLMTLGFRMKELRKNNQVQE